MGDPYFDLVTTDTSGHALGGEIASSSLGWCQEERHDCLHMTSVKAATYESDTRLSAFL
jgi:hypothetical protein